MSENPTSASLPKSAFNEFQKMVAKDWEEGVSLEELLVRVNRVASKMKSLGKKRDSRVSATFQERSFRHYQTLDCIAPGKRSGRRVLYGVRHFKQALLVRRLLFEKVSAERIARLVSRCSAEQMESAILGGAETLKQKEEIPAVIPDTMPEVLWRCIHLIPGVELHMRDDLPKLGEDDLQKLRVLVEDLL